MNSSVARIFLSSTFRDFGEERELLAKRVFPALRKRLQERFVELVDVDLRWGITPEAAERGRVLPICLAEIDRARPWFIGMLGERYGWTPPPDKYDPGLIEQCPWLAEHQGGKSVTELEILHGVLNDPEMAGRAFFYFRAPAYARRKGGDYVSTSSEDAARLVDLKDRIRASGFPVVEDYPDPEALAKRLEADLWAVLDEAYPQADAPDAFTREQRQHEAYALPRRRFYLGGERYQTTLDESLTSGQQRILIEGQSGAGKSALVANWLERRRQVHPAEHIHEYYLGASADAASPVNLVRHLIERIKRTTGSQEEIPVDPQALFDSLATWLAEASAHAGKEDYRWIITLDGLNGLSDLRDLRWLPEFLPERVHMLVSCLPGEVRESLVAKGAWQTIAVLPLAQAEQRQLLQTYLGHYNKTLEAAYETRILAHPLAAKPLFLRTLAEELRLFGRHEELSDELDRYLSSLTVDDLFERVLERVEQDCGARRVKTALTAIWASRVGLAEEELLAYAGLVPATWAPIRLALDEALLESSGRLTFAHDYMRIAVSDRYLAGNNELGDDNQSEEALALRRKAHQKLARWFADHAFSDQFASDGQTTEDTFIDAARAAEEIPYQWQAARNWLRLKKCLTNRAMLEAFLEHRSSEELLGFWLDVEVHTKATLERAYQAAWTQWKPDGTASKTGELAGKLAEFLREAGRFRHPLAITLSRLSLTITEQALGPEHPDTGRRLNNLARLLKAKGDYVRAEPVYRRALDILSNSLGSEHTDAIDCLNNMAVLFHEMGNYASAEPLYRHALAITESIQGPEHPDTGERLNNLASLLRANGNFDEAEALLRRALTIAEKFQGAEHPDTGRRLNHLAILLWSMGQYVNAEVHCRRALSIAEKMQGPEHPDTAQCLNNLALQLKTVGNFTEAEQLYRRALAISERTEGPEHPSTGMTINNLACLLEAMGNYASAELLYHRAVAIAENAQGPDGPDTGMMINNLSRLLQIMGENARAEPLCRRALAITEKTKGSEHPDTAKCINNLARLLQTIGDNVRAESLYRRALTITEKAHGAKNPNVCDTLFSLAEFMAEMDRYNEAEPLLRRAITIFCNHEGDHSTSLATTYHHLGVYLRNADRLEEAEIELQNALAIREAAQPHGTDIAHTLSALGKVHALRGDKSKALGLYERSLEIYLSQTEPNDAGLAGVKQRIAELDAA